jgi:hypothetical protein
MVRQAWILFAHTVKNYSHIYNLFWTPGNCVCLFLLRITPQIIAFVNIVVFTKLIIVSSLNKIGKFYCALHHHSLVLLHVHTQLFPSSGNFLSPLGYLKHNEKCISDSFSGQYSNQDIANPRTSVVDTESYF